MVPLFAAWVIPVAVGLRVASLGDDASHAAVVAATSSAVEIGSRTDARATPVVVEFTMSAAMSVHAVGSGVVTSVEIRVGDAIADGQRIATVDGVGVVASLAEVPFYRELSVGASGADVTALAQVLASAGHPVAGDTTRFTSSMRRSVQALQSQLGATPDGIFRRAYAWWVPPGFSSVAEVRLSVGTHVSDDELAFASARSATSARITQDPSTRGTLALNEGEWDLASGAAVLHLEDGGTLSGVEAARQKLVAAGLIGVPGEQGGTGTLTEAYSNVRVQLRNPTTMGSAPRSSIYTSSSGARCIFIQSDGGLRAEILPTTWDTGIEVSAAHVPAELIGDLVVVDGSLANGEMRRQCA